MSVIARGGTSQINSMFNIRRGRAKPIETQVTQHVRIICAHGAVLQSRVTVRLSEMIAEHLMNSEFWWRIPRTSYIMFVKYT